MNDCCCPTQASVVPADSRQICPHDGSIGQPVQLITLKSLLTPTALEQLDTQASYHFCSSSGCPVVYISNSGQRFMTTDLKVPVFQKENDTDVPICYCFGWTRQRVQAEIEQTGQSSVLEAIAAHIKAKRCGCDVNNPQGHCCLANVRATVEQRSPQRFK